MSSLSHLETCSSKFGGKRWDNCIEDMTFFITRSNFLKNDEIYERGNAIDFLKFLMTVSEGSFEFPFQGLLPKNVKMTVMEGE